MANPLDILGGLIGGIGSQGMAGAYSGEIEGIKTRKAFEAQDIVNQLRQAQLAATQQRQASPMGFQPGTMVLDPNTGRHLFTVPFAPRAPINLGPSHTAFDVERHQPLFTAPPAPRAPLNLGPGHKAFDETGRQIAEVPPNPPTPPHPRADPTESQFWAGIGQRVARGEATPVEQGLWARHQQGKGGAGGGVRETFTEETKITPRKQIMAGTDTFNALNQALPNLVTELSAKPGFNVPGSFVTLPNGMKVRKEDIIAQAMLDRYGAEVTVRWEPQPTMFNKDAGKFTIVKAWDPAQREPVEWRRTTGPAGTIPRTEAEDTEE